MPHVIHSRSSSASALEDDPEIPLPPKIARLAGLGAFGACPAFVALFAYVAFLSLPTPTGGITPVLFAVACLSIGLVVAGLIAVHVILGKQCLRLAQESSTHL
jgi:hypothetical protein